MPSFLLSALDTVERDILCFFARVDMDVYGLASIEHLVFFLLTLDSSLNHLKA